MKKKGFTFAELLVVIAILGIMVSVAVPSIGSTVKYTEKNMTNTVHKILVNAIEGWVKDNYDPSQRPDSFTSVNSQGHPVYMYINNSEIYRNSNLQLSGGSFTLERTPSANQVHVTFEKGVLTTSYYTNVSNPPDVKVVFGVYELTADKSAVAGYDNKLREGYIVKDAYKEVGR